jgi:hypothetical protein
LIQRCPSCVDPDRTDKDRKEEVKPYMSLPEQAGPETGTEFKGTTGRMRYARTVDRSWGKTLSL